MSQTGGTLKVSEDGGDFFDIFQSVSSDASGESHKFISVLPTNIGANVEGYNTVGTKYTFSIPDGVYDTNGSFFTVEATLMKTIADTESKVGEFTVGSTAPALQTHITVQNGASSFFSSAEMLHNATQAEFVNQPGLCEMVDGLCNTRSLAKGAESTDFMFLDRCHTFDAGGGMKYTTTDDNPPVVINNTVSYDPSFEKRCRITGNGPFQISGKLPFTLFKYRTCATYLANASVEFVRAEDRDIIENRSADPEASPAVAITKVVINKITLWMHKVVPSIAVHVNILEGVKNSTHQSIGGKRWAYTGKDIPASLLEPSFQQTLTNRPSKIFVGFRTKKQISQRTWNHNNIGNVTLRLGDRIINDAVLNVRSWASKANETRAVYEHFIAATGQGGVYGEPSISFEQFASNYVLWAFDTSPAASGSLVLGKEPIEMNIDARVIDTGSNPTLTMDIFVCYDGMYTLAGPSGMPTKVY